MQWNSIPFDIILSVTGNTVCPLSVITFRGKIEIRPDPTGKTRLYDEYDRSVYVSSVGVRMSERCVCIQLHSEYTWIYLLKARRTLGVLETLLSLRLDTRASLWCSPILGCLSFIPDIWTTVLVRGILLQVSLILKAPLTLCFALRTLCPLGWPVESSLQGSVKGQRFNRPDKSREAPVQRLRGTTTLWLTPWTRCFDVLSRST